MLKDVTEKKKHELKKINSDESPKSRLMSQILNSLNSIFRLNQEAQINVKVRNNIYIYIYIYIKNLPRFKNITIKNGG
jgi:hypothetical protein